MAPQQIEYLHGHAYIDALLAWELRGDAPLAPPTGPAAATAVLLRTPRRVRRDDGLRRQARDARSLSKSR